MGHHKCTSHYFSGGPSALESQRIYHVMGEQTSPAKNQKVSSMNGVYGCEFLQPTIASLTDVQKRLSNLPRHNYRTTLQWADPWTLMPPPVSQHPSTEPRCLTSQVADQFNRPEYTRGYFKLSQLIPPNIKRVMLEYTPPRPECTPSLLHVTSLYSVKIMKTAEIPCALNYGPSNYTQTWNSYYYYHYNFSI